MSLVGKKKKTITLKETFQPDCTRNCSASARNLRKSDIGAVIFGCKHSTIKECYSKLLFGLPATHFAYVRNVTPGLPLFLFNYSDRKLHGIFEAASPGQLNIDPHGWTADSLENTLYPAQVRVQIRMQCQALTEDQFQPVIADNYYVQRHFWFELDRAQTHQLISLFSSSPAVTNTSLSQNRLRLKPVITALPTPNTKEADDDFKTVSNSSIVNSMTTCPPQKKWSFLFRDTTSSDEMNKKEKTGTVASELTVLHSDQFNEKCEPLCVAPLSTDETVAGPLEMDWPKSESVTQASELNVPNSDQLNVKGKSSSVATLRADETIAGPLEMDRPKSESGTQASELNVPHSDQLNVKGKSSSVAPLRADETIAGPLEMDRPKSESGTQASELNVPHSDQLNVKGKSSSVAPLRADETIAGPLEMAWPKSDSEFSYSAATEEINLEVDYEKDSCLVIAGVQSADECFSEDVIHPEGRSSDSQSPVVKLMEQIEALKASQLKQMQKISFLEHELVKAKADIQQLKNRCNALESRPSSSDPW